MVMNSGYIYQCYKISIHTIKNVVQDVIELQEND